MGGLKTGIPINGKYVSSSSRLENSAYYPDYDNWATSLEFVGLDVFDDKKSDGKLKLGVSLMLALEAGMKIYARDDFSLSAGAFFDYGLNHVIKDRHQPFIHYAASNPSDFNASLFSISDKTKMMAVGIILRVHFKISSP